MNRLKRKNRFIAVLLLFFIVSCGESVVAKNGWIESCPGNVFCFQHPQNLTEVPVQSIDSLSGKYENENTHLSYDMGWYSSNFDELNNAIISSILIDGRSAEILTTDTVMALRIPEVYGSTRFSMMLTFKNSVLIEQGRRIFLSIKFMKERK